MTAKHVALLQAKAVLAALERTTEELSQVTPENAEPKLKEITRSLENDLTAVQRISEIGQLANLPD